jgi:hypothetical protein
MKLLTEAQRRELLANGQRSAAGNPIDPLPVVKLFTPDAGATWLLTELDPEDPERAFGLCDLGLGDPEIGSVSLTELASVRGRLGLPFPSSATFTLRLTARFRPMRPKPHFAGASSRSRRALSRRGQSSWVAPVLFRTATAPFRRVDWRTGDAGFRLGSPAIIDRRALLAQAPHGFDE